MAFASMPLSYKRLYSGALDEDSVFESLSAAQEYAAGATSYAGQIIGVKVDDNNYSPYIINADKTLSPTITADEVISMMSWQEI